MKAALIIFLSLSHFYFRLQRRLERKTLVWAWTHLGLSDNDVDTVWPGLDEAETLDGQVEPLVGVGLQVWAEGQPVLPLTRTQQTAHVVSCNSGGLTWQPAYDVSFKKGAGYQGRKTFYLLTKLRRLLQSYKTTVVPLLEGKI